MSSPPSYTEIDANVLTSTARSEIWYSDGSVVLQAEDRLFRVHWGVLARQSSFFSDMQGLPQPPDQPSVEGCPVIELPDHSADVEHLLTAAYDPSVRPHPRITRALT